MVVKYWKNRGLFPIVLIEWIYCPQLFSVQPNNFSFLMLFGLSLGKIMRWCILRIFFWPGIWLSMLSMTTAWRFPSSLCYRRRQHLVWMSLAALSMIALGFVLGFRYGATGVALAYTVPTMLLFYSLKWADQSAYAQAVCPISRSASFAYLIVINATNP